MDRSRLMSHRIAAQAVWASAGVVMLLAAAGCGRSAEPTPANEDGAAPPPSVAAPAQSQAEAGIGVVSEDELPKLGDPLPPLDEGRMEVAGPEQWHVPPRDPRWLARFQLLASSSYPVILVHLPEAHEGADEVTADNAAAFATNLARQLRRELEPKGLTVPAVEPLVIGDFAGAAYVRQATVKEKGLRLERMYLVTVRGGRRYTVELQAIFGTLEDFRASAIAVAEGMKLLATEAPTNDASE